MNSVFKNALVWVLLGSALIFIFNNVENASSSKREMISYSQFKQEVLSDRIAKVIYKGDQMTIFGERLDGTRFETRHPIYKRDESVDNAIKEHGVITVFEGVEEQPSILSQLLVGFFPILLLSLLLILPTFSAVLARNRNQSMLLWFFLTLIFPFAILFIAYKDKKDK